VSRAEASSSISGIVLDANGGTLSGARITLTSANNSEERTLFSGSNGEFSFGELPAGDFKLTITSPGMEPFVFSGIDLSAGEGRELPQIAMAIQAKTQVEVEFTADNPGANLFHCHQQNHMDAGFMMLLRYE
jgi:hypothetical protein